MLKTELKRNDLVLPELSYKIVGVLFDVWSGVGWGHKEKFYQKATAKGLQDSHLKFKTEVPVKKYYRDKFIGVYYFDFLIENKIVLEIKVRNYFSKNDIAQLYAYLKASNLSLGIIAHFTQSGVKFKRIINLI